MADIILTHGYFLSEDEKEQEIMKPYAPLGLMYLSSYLKSRGFEISLFDTTFSCRSTLEKHLRDNTGGILGIYTNLMTRASVIEILQVAKSYGFTVILGGPESANYPENYLHLGADIVVIGEGEQALDELLPTVQQKNFQSLHNIQGIIFQDENGKIVKTPSRTALRHISTYPWPDRDSVDLNEYMNTWKEHHGSSSISMITARGCPYRCTWCSHAVFGYSHRRRRPEECAEEVEYIIGRYNPDQIWYADDVFTISHPWLYQYADELINRNIKIPFETISRADRLMKPEVIDTLAEIGCDRIWIGSESGSQRILDAMRRDVNVEQVQWACRRLQERGIKVGMFIMWGYGDETVNDIELTVEHVKQSNPDVFFTTVAYPIKGTPFYNEYKDEISLSGDWVSSTDRDYKLGYQRSPEYYRAANTLIFNTVEAERLSGHNEILAKECREKADDARRLLYEYEEQHSQNRTGIR